MNCHFLGKHATNSVVCSILDVHDIWFSQYSVIITGIHLVFRQQIEDIESDFGKIQKYIFINRLINNDINC